MNKIKINLLHHMNRATLTKPNERKFNAGFFKLQLAVLTLFTTQIVFGQLPVDPVVMQGNAAIDVSGGHMSITNAPGTVVNWHDFSIGNGNSVFFHQQDASSQILNRVTGNNISEILGSLGSNGGVWLINPHGVLFGENARVDVGSLVTSTLNITDFDFLAKNYQFNALEGGSGNVSNHGEIRTSLGGHVWMLGEQVHQSGLIQSPDGQIVLAAGRHVEMIDSGAPNLVVRVEAPENNGVNLGHLVSANGQMDVLGSIVNLDGINRAQDVTSDALGNIVLQSADTVQLSENSVLQAGAGTVDVKADDVLLEGQIVAQAGTVSVKAADLTYLGGQIDVSDQYGAAGKILFETGRLEGMAGGALVADGQQGGQIRVVGENTVAFSSSLEATGSEQGGKIDVSGDSVLLLNADVDASGGSGQGGIVHLGGGWQGEDDLPHAREVIVGVGSEVSANGVADGGEIVVWSEQIGERHGLLLQADGLQDGLSSPILSESDKNISDTNLDNLVLIRKIVSGDVVANSKDNESLLGMSIAMDGDRLVIGAPGDDTNGTDRGAVYLFTGMGTENIEGLSLQKKIASGIGANNMGELNDFDFFGGAVALDGDHLAVGARGSILSTTNQGAVYLFSGVGKDFSSLTRQNKIASGVGASGMPTLADFDFFGTALALDGDRLVIGASGDSTLVRNSGAVHLFKGIETNIANPSWVGKIASNSGAISMPSLGETDFFGWSLALDGDRLVVGAFSDSGKGEDQGSVHLFGGAGVDFSGLAWQGKIESNSGASGMPGLADKDYFGWSLALNGDHLAVGAFGDDATGNNQGAVYLFESAGEDFSGLTWVDKLASKVGAIGMTTLANDDGFGWSLAMTDDHLAVASLRDNGGESAVFLFGFGNKSSVSTVNTATIDSSVQNLNSGSAGAQFVSGAIETGALIDISVSQGSAFRSFSTRDLSRMSAGDMQQLMIERQQYKEMIFANAIYALELDPSLADVPICKNLDEMQTGLCRITEAQRDEYKSKLITSEDDLRQLRVRNIPQIDRKFIVLFGIDQYEDKVIPPLESAIFDAEAVGKTFAERLGYREHVIRNATRTELVRTLNQLAVEMEPNDSVVIYYAGHGFMLEDTGHGYWIPSDASATDPESWISNKSISEMLMAINSKQIAVISDSCYSGVFASESKLEDIQSTEDFEEILQKKGVMAMTAGANEPVSDEGRDGHSIFAWYLMKTIQQVNTWETGLNLFKTIQSGVSQSFPQTPQYGGLTSAGYQEGGDYLFEYRQFEDTQ